MNKQAVRERFRSQVFARDGNHCTYCDCRENLDAHHITDRNEMPNGGYVRENGITLCPVHHRLAEVFHSSNGRTFSIGMHPNDLYAKIKSSYSLAYDKSVKLR